MNDAEAESATKQAIREGRVNGKYRCPRCGMRSDVELEAAECCRGLGPPSLEKVSDSRFVRHD